MAEPVPAADTTVDNADVSYVYTEKANGGFRKAAKAEFAHAIGKSAADKGKLYYFDADGNFTLLLPGADGDLITYVSSIPTTFTPNYSTLDGEETLENKDLPDSTTAIVDNLDPTKKLRFQVSGITTSTTRVMTLPDYDFTVASLAGAEIFTNKSLSDSTTYVIDNADNTKKFQFQASGITTGTTRTLTAPDLNGTIALTSDVAYDYLGSSSVNAATIDFTSSIMTSSYDTYVFKLRRVFTTVTGANRIGIRVSENGGSSFISSGYSYIRNEWDDGTLTNTNPTAQSEIIPFNQNTYASISDATDSRINGEIILQSGNLSITTGAAIIHWNLYRYNTGGWMGGTVQVLARGSGWVSLSTSSSTANGFRLLNTAGNDVGGVIDIYGVRST